MGYIVQAIQLERLDFDKAAMRDVMMSMPVAARQGRWKWMAQMVGAMD
jgi:hypothetical protein